MTHEEREHQPSSGPTSPPNKEAEIAAAATPSPEHSASNCPVVGVGASAGGLEALTSLLQAMPPDCGFAIVIVHHADPHHESLMVDLLSKRTAMPVAFARNGAVVEANHVYIIPPNSFLALLNGALRLSSPETGHAVRLPIDFFLRSLAMECRERAIAIILSGTGSDGTLGVTAVKENGGMAMAQAPAEAGQDGMPRSAIATKLIDHVLRVAEMPARLMDYTRHPYTGNGAPPQALGDRARAVASLAGPAAGAAGQKRDPGWSDLSRAALLEHYAPAAVLVNEDFEALHFHGATDRYLRMPSGEPRHSLPALAREGLGSELSGALREARHRRHTAVRNATARREGQNFPVTISAHPVTSEHARMLLVTFVDRPAPVVGPAASVSAVDPALLQQLQQELNSTKESLNEELTSLNAQLQHKIEEERVLSDDLGNLLVSSDIATLFLDRNLNIKRFTRPAARLFNLVSSDVGRPISDITRGVEDPELVKDAESVLAELTPSQREVKGKLEDWYIRRILPYRTQEKRIDGVVITFTDVSKLKVAETQAKAAQAFAENIIDTLHESVIVLDRELRIQAASTSFYKTFRIEPEDVPGQLIFDLDGGQWDIPKLRELLLRVIPDTATVEDFEVTHDFPRLGHRIMLLNARRIRNSDDTDGLCLVTIEDITQRRAAEHALMEREAYLKAVLATAPDGIITIDERGIVKSFSPAAERLFGFTEEEIVGSNVAQYLKTGEAKIGRGREVIGLRKDGTELPLRLSVAEMKLPGHRVFVGILHDLTEEKRRNEEHLQAQKMEALGQLAGGIAHDFNNLLTIIIGNNERIQEGVEENELHALLDQNYNAAERGGSLTKRLLSFAHRSRLEPTTLRLNERVGSMIDMLRRTIGEGIVVTSAMTPELWYVRVDPGEVDHALLNLVLNARDAMPSGGTVTIETANETFAADRTPADLVPGDYVRLSVIDTGVGMTPAVLKRAVDPFFTTKPPSKGTGLGLASAYGFARQSGGCLVITSKVGKGTTVSLCLPRAPADAPLPAPSADEPGIPLGDGELVLVVDDDDEVREVTLKRLESLGYAVIEAAAGPKAIERCAGEPVALALIDIVMPGGLSGYEVAENLGRLNPDIKVLLTTGYDGAGRKSEPEATENFKVLQKPYTRAELAQAVAEALAG